MAIINYIEKHIKTFTVKSHSHTFWEIIYVTDGSGVIKTEDKETLEYQKGNTVCIPPNVKHTNISTAGFKNIHFTIEDWSAPFNKPFSIAESDTSKDFYSVLKLTYRYFHQLPPSHPVNVAFTETIVSFLNGMIEQSNAYNTTQVIVNEIINSYTDVNFDLNKAYELVPLSKEHLRKLFIKQHGVSPTQFLKQKRLSLAKQLLSRKEDGYLRINEIAFSCGFDDPAYFCRIFKNETGVTPQNFQLKLLNSNKIFEEDKENK